MLVLYALLLFSSHFGIVLLLQGFFIILELPLSSSFKSLFFIFEKVILLTFEFTDLIFIFNF